MCGPIRCAIWRFEKARELIMCRCVIAGSAARLILEIDIRQLLPVVVAHDKAGVVEFFDRPRRREASRGGHSLTKSPKFIDRPADDDRTNERIEKYGDPSASNHVASSGAVDRSNKLTEKYAYPSEPNHVASND